MDNQHLAGDQFIIKVNLKDYFYTVITIWWLNQRWDQWIIAVHGNALQKSASLALELILNHPHVMDMGFIFQWVEILNKTSSWL